MKIIHKIAFYIHKFIFMYIKNFFIPFSLFLFSFYIASLPYLSDFFNSFPLGWDVMVYVERMRIVENGSFGNDVRLGYIIIGVLIHKLTGIDYLMIIKILPILITSLIPVIIYYMMNVMLDIKILSYTTGILTILWGARLRLLEDLYDNNFVLLLFLIFNLIFFIDLKNIVNNKNDFNMNRFFSAIKLKYIIILMWMAFTLPEMYIFNLMIFSFFIFLVYIYRNAFGREKILHILKITATNFLLSGLLFIVMSLFAIQRWLRSYNMGEQLNWAPKWYVTEWVQRYSHPYPQLKISDFTSYVWGDSNYVSYWLMFLTIIGLIYIIYASFFQEKIYLKLINIWLAICLIIPVFFAFSSYSISTILASLNFWSPDPERFSLMFIAPIPCIFGIYTISLNIINSFTKINVRINTINKIILKIGSLEKIPLAIFFICLLLLPQTQIIINKRNNAPLNIDQKLVRQLNEVKLKVDPNNFVAFLYYKDSWHGYLPSPGEKRLLEYNLHYFFDRPYAVYFGKLNYLSLGYTPNINTFDDFTSKYYWDQYITILNSVGNKNITYIILSNTIYTELREYQKESLTILDDDIYILPENYSDSGYMHAIYDGYNIQHGYGLDGAWALEGRYLEHWSQKGTSNFSASYLLYLSNNTYQLSFHMKDVGGHVAPLMVKINNELIGEINFNSTGKIRNFDILYKSKNSGTCVLTIEMNKPGIEHYINIDYIKINIQS